MKKLVTILATVLVAVSVFAAAPKCKGVTKQNTPCKKGTTHETGYCFTHRAQSTNEVQAAQAPASTNAVVAAVPQ